MAQILSRGGGGGGGGACEVSIFGYAPHTDVLYQYGSSSSRLSMPMQLAGVAR